MDDHVAFGNALGDRRVADVENPPLHPVDVTAAFVDPDDPLDLGQTDQLRGERTPDSRRGTGHSRDETSAAPSRGGRAAGRAPATPGTDGGGFVVQNATPGLGWTL